MFGMKKLQAKLKRTVTGALAAVMLLGTAVPAAMAAEEPQLPSSGCYLQFDGTLDNQASEAVPVMQGTETYEDGVQGQAIHLNEENYVKITAGEGIPSCAESFSVSFWLKLNEVVGGDPALLGNKNWNSGNNPGWVFYVKENGPELNYKTVDGDRTYVTDLCTTEEAMEWTHFAATFDFASNLVTVYCNGERVQESSASLAGADGLAGLGDIFLGQTHGNDGGVYNTADNHTDFLLDEFRLEAGVLSGGQIEQIYLETKPVSTDYTVESVSVSQPNLRMDKGTSFHFVATVNGEKEPPQDVNWTVEGQTSPDTSIDESGLLTIGADETAQLLRVIATSQYAEVSGEASVTVTEPRTDGGVSFAVISDIHVGPTGKMNNERAIKAMEYFSSEELDNEVLVINGDMTDGTETNYNWFHQLKDEHLTIPLAATMGNHDENKWARFENATGCKANDVKIINGYTFLFLSPGAGELDEETGRATGEDTGDYTYLREWVTEQIAAAEARDPNKPIFVFAHHPIENTVYVSEEDGIDSLEGLFDGHSQVVLFSGHIHSPNNHPRSIWQDGGFTAVNDAATCSADMEGGMISGGVPPTAMEMSQGLYVEADEAGNVTIKTRDFINDRWVEDQIWSFNVNEELPYTTEKRTAESPVPEFSQDASIRLSNLNMSSVDVEFDQAEIPQPANGNIVHSYRFDFVDTATGEVVKSFSDWANFWLYPVTDPLSQSVQGLTPNTSYELRIYAVDAYGRTSDTCLTTEFTTPSNNTRPYDLMDYALPFNGTLENLGKTPEAVSMFKLEGVMDGQEKYAEGKHGDAIYLDARNFVNLDDVGDIPIIDYTQSFTVALWMNIAEINMDGEPAIVSNRNRSSSDGNGYCFQVDNVDGQIMLQLKYRTVAGDDCYTENIAPLNKGEWVHIAGTFDNDNNLIKCYVNGEMVKEIPCDLSAGMGGITADGRIKSTFLGSSPWNYTEIHGGFNSSFENGRHVLYFWADDFVLSGCVYTDEQIQAVMENIEDRPAVYAVNFELNGGEPAQEAQTVFDGCRVVRPADPTKEGEEFEGWYKDAGCTEAWDFANGVVNADMTLYAKWSGGSGSGGTSGGSSGGSKPAQPETPEKLTQFDDVAGGAWYEEAVAYAVEHGLMNGTSATNFTPEGNTTRGMIVTILYRLAGSPSVEAEGDAWYADARAWAISNGISDGTGMEKAITREQLAAMLYRFAGVAGKDLGEGASMEAFADSDKVSSYATQALGWAVGKGIVAGKTSSMLAPQNGATRAEAAMMIMRFCEL